MSGSKFIFLDECLESVGEIDPCFMDASLGWQLCTGGGTMWVAIFMLGRSIVSFVGAVSRQIVLKTSGSTASEDSEVGSSDK